MAYVFWVVFLPEVGRPYGGAACDPRQGDAHCFFRTIPPSTLCVYTAFPIHPNTDEQKFNLLIMLLLLASRFPFFYPDLMTFGEQTSSWLPLSSIVRDHPLRHVGLLP